MKLDRSNHLVLTVRNIETTCTFYSNVLGMEVVTFENGRKALSFGSQKSTSRSWQGIRTESLQTYSGLSRPVLHNHNPY